MADALVGLIMGSKSDWDTMQHAAQILDALGVPHETKVVSAHRTPDLLFEYAESAESRGIQVIIAGAGGAAHLPGMAAAKTTLPVLGVPVDGLARVRLSDAEIGAVGACDDCLPLVKLRLAQKGDRTTVEVADGRRAHGDYGRQRLRRLSSGTERR